MTPLTLRPGIEVMAHGCRYRISQVQNLERVVAMAIADGTTHTLRIRDLEPVQETTSDVTEGRPPPRDPGQIDDNEWRIAQERFAIIRPLLEAQPRTLELVALQATQAGVHISTIYRWLERYESTGLVSALLPIKPEGGRGETRLAPEVEGIVDATLQDHYLTSQRPTIKDTFEVIRRRCRRAGLRPPSLNTVRTRIAQVPDAKRLRRRGQRRQAQALYEPIQGPFPNADYPLAVVQIDHTPVDIILVDDLHRLPIGRPWVTLAIDVFSRMVAGFYISLDPPSALSVGLCLTHAILPKDAWLSQQGIDTAWPVWGVMDVVHADNAKEFRGKMLTRACQEYGIDLHWRPVARPKFGGHIERLCGTLNHAVHTLPGTTFSNPTERGDYPSEAKAVLTLSELDHWLAVYITQVYHQRNHDGLGRPPIQQFEQGIFGDSEHPGRGLPPRPMDPDRIRLDFMPYLERTVQPYGLQIDGISYFHDVLKPWINAREPGQRAGKRQFILRRDPRDISVVYFYDPELKQYFEIPYRDTTHPSMSLWELRAARRKLKEDGQNAVNEELIFAAHEHLQTLEDEAVRKTKKARRAAQRRRLHAQIERPELPASSAPPSSDFPVTDLADIQPFDEIEDFNG